MSDQPLFTRPKVTPADAEKDDPRKEPASRLAKLQSLWSLGNGILAAIAVACISAGADPYRHLAGLVIVAGILAVALVFSSTYQLIYFVLGVADVIRMPMD